MYQRLPIVVFGDRRNPEIDKHIVIQIAHNYRLLDVLLYNTGIYLDEYTA